MSEMSEMAEVPEISETPETHEIPETVEAAAVELNAIVEGEVLKIKAFGAIVQLPDKSQGLVHISHISNRFVQNIEEFVNVGDIVSVKVIGIDPESGKISLSMKETEPAPAPSSYRSGRSSYSNDRPSSDGSFEEKFKDWLKSSNERQAGLNKRNKRR